MDGNADLNGEGRNCQAGKNRRGFEISSFDGGEEAVAALIDGLNAVVRMQVRAQRGKQARHRVGGYMEFTPERLFYLGRRNDLTGMGEQQPQCSEFARR